MSMTQVIGESAKSARRRGPGRKRRPAAGAGRRWWPGDGADARESYLVLLPPEDGAPMTAGRARRRGEELGGRLATRLRSEFGVRVDVRRAGDPPEGSSEERAEELRRHPKLVRVVAFAGLNAVWVDGTPAIGMFLRRGRRQREEAVVRSPQMVICRSPGAGGESTESHGVPDGQWAKEVGDQHRWHLAHPEAGVGAAGKEVGDGAGIVVGFLDTGINASHPEFVGKRVWYKRIGRDGGYVGGAAADPDGHGTFCASLACGRDCGSAPKADVAMAAAPLGALDSPGQIAQQVLTGVDFLMTLDRGGNEDDAPVGVDVLNFSLGVFEPDYVREMRAVFRQVRRTLAHVVCAASGNAPPAPSPAGYPFCPATVPGVWGVGAHDRSLAIWDGSCFGKLANRRVPRYYAPGVDVWGARAKGGYTTMTGTSMACAVAAGAFARGVGLQRMKRRDYDGKNYCPRTRRFEHGGTRFDRII